MKSAISIFFWIILLGLIGCMSPKKAEKEEMETLPSYTEQHRPQYHFTPPSQWMNDPNGMFYFEEEYHLFYQYYPDSNVWGPMHWGHAVSRDMVYWEHLPIALYPDSLGYIFSGSAVVDWNNTSGFGKKDNPPLVSIYTYHNMEGEKAGTNDFQFQGIAYSLDKGRTWEKYEKNPILNNPGIKDFRDPKVFWHKASQNWIMSLAVADHISFYSSTNLIEWVFQSDFGKGLGAQGGVWECPDLFPLKLEDSKEEKYVLLVSINPGGPNGGSATQYFVGEFDGKEFKLDDGFLDNGPVWLDYGRDNYAGVTWSDIPETDGRRLFIGWMSNWDYARKVPTYEWRSAMTLPRELKLTYNGNYRLKSIPVKELKYLRTRTHSIPPYTIAGEFDISKNAQHSSARFELEMNLIHQEKFSLIFSNLAGEELILEVDPEKEWIRLNRDRSGDLSFSEKFKGKQGAPLYLNGDSLNIRVFVDESSLELFCGDNQTVMTSLHFPSEPFNNVKLVTSGATYFGSIKIHDLSSIWPVN